jgi:hypothetical protein
MQFNHDGTQRNAAGSQSAQSTNHSAPTGYGLPCANCRKYYAADLPACPTCNSTQRIAASTSPATENHGTQILTNMPPLNPPEAEPSKPAASHAPAHLTAAAAKTPACSNQRKSSRPHAPVTVCKTCYEETKDRMNTMEASLHMDLREATQIIYEAVWADTSDPNKSYQNAAQALLTELRKRAGVTVLLGPIQLLPH